MGEGRRQVPPEYDLDAARARIRRRSSGYMALVLGPVLVIGSLVALVVRVVAPHAYPAGDIRNEPLFWIAAGGLILVITVIVVLGNIRARAWRADPPTIHQGSWPTNPDSTDGVSGPGQ